MGNNTRLKIKNWILELDWYDLWGNGDVNKVDGENEAKVWGRRR